MASLKPIHFKPKVKLCSCEFSDYYTAPVRKAAREAGSQRGKAAQTCRVHEAMLEGLCLPFLSGLLSGPKIRTFMKITQGNY